MVNSDKVWMLAIFNKIGQNVDLKDIHFLQVSFWGKEGGWVNESKQD